MKRELSPEELRKRVLHLESLLEVGRTISREMVLDRLLVVVMDQVTSALGADRSTLFLYDPDRGELWSQVSQGEEQIRIPATKGLAGHAVRTGTSLNIPDAYRDPRFNPEVDTRTGYHTHSMLVVPIRRRSGEAVGVIQVINKLEGVSFDEEDLAFLETLTGQIAIAIDNARLYGELKEIFDSLVESLADTIDRRHPFTAGHTARVRDYSLALGRRMGLDEKQLELLKYAATLHDYGKIAIPDAVLRKAGRLTDEEFAVMKTHASITRDLLSKIKLRGRFPEIVDVACHHHERMDGAGYPDGLRGEAIHPLARIMAVADVFDALTSERDYRKAMPVSEALGILGRERGTHFDPACIDAFVEWVRRSGLAEELDQRNGFGATKRAP
jgi:HD-GYP domain-containing protein (c-di-GMP phosphodiesterase class II)